MPFVAETILSDFRSSSSLPVLVETIDGPRCVVKWKGAGEGALANAVDWVSLHFARLTGIPVPTPHLITITSNLIDKTRDPDVNDLITRSLGVNLGVEFLEGSTPFTLTHVDAIDQALKTRIFLFDVLFLNIDRTDHNPNMVFSEDTLYCIDFAAAMSLKMLMNRQNHSERALLSVIRRHPFYKKTAESEFIDLDVDAQTVDDIVSVIPDDWLVDPAATKGNLELGIRQILEESHSILKHRLAILETLPLESEEERRVRTLKNRRAFEARWSK
jgi:hypothetical protein